MKSQKELLEMEKNNLLREITGCREIIRGTLMRYYLTCGTKGCHCHEKGSKKHGPYWYIAVSYGCKKKQKLYKIKKEVVKDAREKIANYKRLWEIICEISEKNIQLMRI